MWCDKDGLPPPVVVEPKLNEFGLKVGPATASSGAYQHTFMSHVKASRGWRDLARADNEACLAHRWGRQEYTPSVGYLAMPLFFVDLKRAACLEECLRWSPPLPINKPPACVRTRTVLVTLNSSFSCVMGIYGLLACCSPQRVGSRSLFVSSR